MTYVALSLSVVALMLSLWSVREKFAGLWGRKHRGQYPPPCDTTRSPRLTGTAGMPPNWAEKTSPPTDPNIDIVTGLQEWPGWTVDMDRWKAPEERMPGDPSFRIKS